MITIGYPLTIKWIFHLFNSILPQLKNDLIKNEIPWKEEERENEPEATHKTNQMKM